MRIIKNGVARFLKPKKKKPVAQASLMKAEVLTQPEEAKTSILRVILLVA